MGDHGMHNDYWRERWHKGQIGFHQSEVETFLASHFGRLGLARGSTIFVPLCGKSLDLLWLAEQGHQVVGVEVSSLACESFFAENRIDASVPVSEGPFRVHRAKDRPITIYEGDFFDLSSSQLGTVDALYDRASLIALPPELRQRYVQHLKTALLAPETRGLLITVAYDQSTFPGPPFSVPPEEVQTLWQDRFRIELVGRGEENRTIPMIESAWLLTPRETP
jgi:thiopurine S-methyltransferase